MTTNIPSNHYPLITEQDPYSHKNLVPFTETENQMILGFFDRELNKCSHTETDLSISLPRVQLIQKDSSFIGKISRFARSIFSSIASIFSRR